MVKELKRILCIMLAVLMALSNMTFFSFAEEAENVAEEPTESVLEEPEEVEVPEAPVYEENTAETVEETTESPVISDDSGTEAIEAAAGSVEENVESEEVRPVRATFLCSPAETVLTVYQVEEDENAAPDAPEKRIIFPPEENEDHVYQLFPGTYFYSAYAEGYEPLEKKVLSVEKEAVEIEVELMVAEPADVDDEDGEAGGDPVPAETENGAETDYPEEEEAFVTVASLTGENITGNVQNNQDIDRSDSALGGTENPDSQADGTDGDTTVPDPEKARQIGLDREYLILPVGETASLTVTGIPEAWLSSVIWSVEDSNGNPLDSGVLDPVENGEVIASEEGTAFVVASLICEEQVFKARCRVDVIEEPVVRETVGVSLLTQTATVELFSTQYTEVNVLIGFEQNGASFASTNDSAVPDNGVAIEKASFLEEPTASNFWLRVKDDRTLQIIPNPETAIANSKQLGTKFTSAIKIEGRGWEAETGELKLTIKKTVPRIKATALKFNSFVPNETLPLAFTGGVANSISLNTDAKAKEFCPNWLSLDPDNGTLTLADSAKDQKLSGKVWLYVTVDGWTEHLKLPVTVNVSAAKKAPKLTFNPNTLTLNPKAGDVAETVATVDLAEFRDSRIQFEEITLNNKIYEEGNLICSGEAADGVITVKTAPGFNADAAKTFKVFYSVAGEKYSFTVKTLAAPKTTPSFTLKASGTIDTGISSSSVTITVTPKNYTTAKYTVAAINQYNASSKKYDIDAMDLFLFDDQWSGNSLMLKQNSVDLTDGKYQVTVRTEVAGETLIKDVVFTVTSKAVPSVTLKAAGRLDVIRPESFITLTPTIKNWYDHKLSKNDLIFYKGTGKNTEVISPDAVPFDVEPGEKTFTIKLKQSVDYKVEKYSVGMRDGTGTIAGGAPLTKSPTALTITMGSAKFTQSAKTVEIVNKDRYSYGTLRLTPTDDTLAPISSVELDAKSKELLDAVLIDNNQIALHYKEDKITSDKKISAKLSIFLKGNPTVNDKGELTEGNTKKVANATISVTVNVIKVESFDDITRTGWFLEEAFPDAKLRMLVSQFDLNGNGVLEKDEMEAVVELNCSGQEITSLEGLELFTNLETLDCSSNNLTELDLRKNAKLTVIRAGDNSDLVSVLLPESLPSLQENAFKNCTSLTEIRIPANVTEIPDYAFYNCVKLVTVTMSNHVTRIGVAAFKDCSSLTHLSGY